MIMDVHRAFLHLVEDKLVVVNPPEFLKDADAAAAREPARLCA